MKRILAFAAALMVVVPGAAMAQQTPGWELSKPNEDGECFAMFYSGAAAFGVQAPNGNRAGAFVVMAPVEANQGDGDPIMTIGAPGPFGGKHVAKTDDDPQLSTFFVRVEDFTVLNAFPDRWHLNMAKGKTKVMDVDLTGFRAALAAINRCVAAR